ARTHPRRQAAAAITRRRTARLPRGRRRSHPARALQPPRLRGDRFWRMHRHGHAGARFEFLIIGLLEKRIMETPNPTRRIITGNDAQGRSRIDEDGPTPAVRRVAERPGYQVCNLWATEGTPARIAGPVLVGELKGVLPPKNG